MNPAVKPVESHTAARTVTESELVSCWKMETATTVSTVQRAVKDLPSLSCTLLQAASPVCIVHGPFGCGKSTLLVALLHYLLAQRKKAKSALKGCRVLVTAHTNVAVDRVISGLVDSGCTGLKRAYAMCNNHAIHIHNPAIIRTHAHGIADCVLEARPACA